jgi:hypothetical protein
MNSSRDRYAYFKNLEDKNKEGWFLLLFWYNIHRWYYEKKHIQIS